MGSWFKGVKIMWLLENELFCNVNIHSLWVMGNFFVYADIPTCGWSDQEHAMIAWLHLIIYFVVGLPVLSLTLLWTLSSSYPMYPDFENYDQDLESEGRRQLYS